MSVAPYVNLSHADPQSDLDAVKRQIESVSSQLDKAQSSRAAIEVKLGQNKSLIAKLVEQMHDIDDRLDKFQREVDRIRTQNATTETVLNANRDNILTQIKVAYSVGRQDYLKLLLNQEDPKAILRALTLHKIIRTDRNTQLRKLHDRVRRNSTEERLIDDKIAALAELRKRKTATQVALLASENQRESLLATLATEIEDTATRLEQLRLDEEKLENLLTVLNEDLTDIPEVGEESEPFASFQGSLAWPARGAVLHRFGTERGATGFSWQGVLIGSKQGDPVHAVSHGRVAFAGPLKGFGLLLIIDHGDGYMSLYGRNGHLFKEVGDWVRAGEVVANVGKSNGDERTGLYFEIRHNGKPKNPVKWCRGASPLAADALVNG